MSASRLAADRLHGIAEDLEFTGERIVPGKTEEALFREHEERYVFAGQYVAGKDVLDVACGTGIGTAYLRKAGAKSCAGVDIDQGAIDYAKAAYKGCRFTQSDATKLSLQDECVDVVVSFETIEHVEDQAGFLEECKRVLRPGGLLICSTPNRAIFKWYDANPHHTCELTPQEFVGLLGSHFSNLCLFAQAKRVYPLHILRRLASQYLEGLRLKRAVKRVMGLQATPQDKGRCFFGAEGSTAIKIQPYRQSRFFQPTYAIAIGRRC